MMTLDITSGGKVLLTVMRETDSRTYRVKDDKLQLSCPQLAESIDFIILSCGSLSGPEFVGNMKKSIK
jgi:hypothetical protein